MLTRSTTVVDPQHLKVQGQNICRTKNYCITHSKNHSKSLHHSKNPWATPIFHHAHTKKLSTFNFCEFASTCKELQFHPFVQKILINLKIKESDWLRPFWLISREQDFSQIKDLCRNTTNNINFHYTTNSVKIIYQIFP